MPDGQGGVEGKAEPRNAVVLGFKSKVNVETGGEAEPSPRFISRSYAGRWVGFREGSESPHAERVLPLGGGRASSGGNVHHKRNRK